MKTDIEASRAICGAATPGPLYVTGGVVWVEDRDPHTGKPVQVPIADAGEADAIFFAHARTALPLANAELAEVRAEIERAKVVMEQMAGALTALRQASPDTTWQYHDYADAALDAYRKWKETDGSTEPNAKTANEPNDPGLTEPKGSE